MMQKVVENPSSFGCSSVTHTLFLGDNFYNSGVSSIHDPLWKSVFVEQFKQKLGLSMRYLTTLGDHDAASQAETDTPNVTRMQAQVDYFKQVDSAYYLPDFNYSITVDFEGGEGGTTKRRVKFVMMNGVAIHACIHQTASDCALFGSGGLDEHLSWIDHELSLSDHDSTIDAVVLVNHFAIAAPLYGHYCPKLDKHMSLLARQHRVSLILSGHSHYLAWSQTMNLGTSGFERGQLTMIVNGAGRGAAPYRCDWKVTPSDSWAPLVNKTCMSSEENEQGMFVLHRLTSAGFENVAIDGITGIVGSISSEYRAAGGSSHPPSPPSPTPAPHPVGPTSPPAPPGTCGTCSAAICSHVQCSSAAPFLCTAGPAKGGCSASPWHVVSSACSSCCDVQKC